LIENYSPGKYQRASESTIRYTARLGIVPWILTSNPPDFQRLCHVYQEVAQEAGRSLALGESVGAFRAVHFGKTEADAVALLRDTNYRGFKEYFSGFGFGEAFRTEADNATYPQTPLPLEELTVERLRRVKYALAGTPEQVRAEMEALHTLYGSGGELEWFGWFFDQGFMSWDETQRQFESFAKEIIPHFR